VGGVTDARSTVWRWRDAFQRDFQARMDWCVKPRAAANHQPVAVCNGDATRSAVTEHARAGAIVRLSAAGSRDPDGHELAYRWSIYPEAGSYRGKATIQSADSPEATVSLPPEGTGDLHVILEVTDNGQPPLSSCRRAIIGVD